MKMLFLALVCFYSSLSLSYTHQICSKQITRNVELAQIVDNICDSNYLNKYLAGISGIDRFLNIIDYKIMNNQLVFPGKSSIDIEILPLCSTDFKRPGLYQVQDVICEAVGAISNETLIELRPILYDTFSAEIKYLEFNAKGVSSVSAAANADGNTSMSNSNNSGWSVPNLYTRFSNNLSEAINTPNSPLDHPSCVTTDPLIDSICRVANFSNMPDLMLEKLQIIFK